jgi:arylsulfatase A-like enzyme
MHPRPNILLLHGHDMGRWVSCYSHPAIPTPRIEELAAQSLVFDEAFSAAPLCTPSRGAMLTGMSPHANGLNGLAHDSWLYFSDVKTLPDHLRALGYHTALIGLQHENPDPLVLGYDEVVGLGFLPRALMVAEDAAAWLSRPVTDERPWIANVGMWEAHRPWPSEDYDPVDPATVEVPGYLPDNDFTRADIAAMYGSLRQFDAAVGRILDALATRADGANTLVILTTDHGVPFPRAKSTLYDAGTGVMFIAKPPASWRVTPRRVLGQVSHLDLVPTLVELAGGIPTAPLEGTSLADVLTGEADVEARPIFTEKSYHDGYDPIRAVRDTGFKYIRNFAPGPLLPLARDLEESLTRQGLGDAHLAPRPEEELYDLRADPDELHNLAGDPGREHDLSRFARLLHDWMVRTTDPILTGPIRPMPRPARPTRERP